MTKLLSTDGEGERIDRFELIAELASGGMATVFLARLSGVAGFQRLVAIKRLHPHLAKEPEFVEMFLDEARLAARIHHPNVVPIQEVGESERGYYLVMDYVDGDTFARLLARAAQANRPVPTRVTVRVMLDILSGLHAAHELRDDSGEPLMIVHRDVSPQNLLVGVDGISRITDFGVARAASRLSTTRSGQLKGKLAYMAPEQAQGTAVDRRADVFSCGIVLWEALTLKRLFKGDGEAETLNRVLYDPIAPPRSARPDVPKALADICMKALDRDLNQRWPTCLDFADALESAARELGVVGSPRDVAGFVDEVIGADLTQQRDALRQWLARSEPSGSSKRPAPRISSPPRSNQEDVTRVEAKADPLGSRTGQSASPSSAVPPENVSSVSSAVIPVGAPHSRGRVVLFVAAALLLVGMGAWGAMRYQRHTTAVAATAPPPSAVAAETPSSTTKGTPPLESALPVAPGPSASPSESSAVAPKPVAPKPTGQPRPRPPTRPTQPHPSATPAQPTADPDAPNLSNPYR